MSIGSRPLPTSPPIWAAHRWARNSPFSPYQDFDDPKRREDLTQIAIDCWAEVAEHAKAAGLHYVFWEPMSIGRNLATPLPNAWRCKIG